MAAGDRLVDGTFFAPPTRRRVVFADSAGQPAQTGIALLRIVTGSVVATLHGWHKVVQGWDYVTAGSDWPLLHDIVQLGLPLPGVFAILAALSQFGGGCLLALGASTRVAAFLVASTMVTALVFNLQSGGPDAELAGLYGLVTGAFAVAGGGRWSLDRHFEEKRYTARAGGTRGGGKADSHPEC